MIEYKVNDTKLLADKFILFVNQIWKGNYDLNKTTDALSKTINITAYDGNTLIGCLRILSDGYYFGTITELLVLPNIKNKELVVNFFNLQKIIHLLYYILEPNQE